MTESRVQDVLELFKTTSRECLNDSNPMLASDNFSLYESMSAVVIMDEKMDPCYGISCSTFENFVTNKFEICGESTEITATLLIQELFRREVAFIDGASLLESLHQGLHMWPDTWKLLEGSSSSASDKWVASFCRSIVASATVFHRLVMNADIYEDEDFQFQSKVSSFLTQDEMELLCKETKTLSSDASTVLNNQYIKLFFKYRSLFFELNEAIDELISLSLTLPLSTRGSNSSQQQIAQMTSKLESEGKDQQDQNDQHLCQSLHKVYTISHTIHSVVSEILAYSEPPPPSVDSATSDQKQFIENSFLKSLMNIQQTSPARTFPLLSFHNSLKYFLDMTQDLMCLCTSINTMMFQTENLDIDTLLQWFTSFSRNKSNVLVRSYLVAVWSFLKPHVKVFLLNSCDSRGIPSSILSTSLCEEWFRSSVSFLLWDTIKVLTVHRNKIQLKLDNLFARWGNFVTEAQYVDRAVTMQLMGDDGPVTVDQANTQPWFHLWTLNHMTTVMDIFMELFMELDLLNGAEYSSYYWYWDYIISTKGYALKSLREVSNSLKAQLYEVDVKEAKEAVTKAKSAMNSNKKSKKAKNTFNEAKSAYASIMATPPPVPAHFSTEEIFCILKGQILKALFRFYMALDEGGVIRPADSPCSTPDLIFACRYRSFLAIGNPAPISYADFLGTKSSSNAESLEPVSLITSADGLLKTVKTLVTRALTAVPMELNLDTTPSGAARWPRCVCQAATPATAKLSANDKYPNAQLSSDVEVAMSCQTVFIQDMIAVFEGQPKVSVTLSLACTRQLQRLSASTSPPDVGRTSYRMKLDRKFSECYPVPTVDVILKEE